MTENRGWPFGGDEDARGDSSADPASPPAPPLDQVGSGGPGEPFTPPADPTPLVEPLLPPPALQPPPALIPPVERPTYPAVPPRIEDIPTEAMPVVEEPLPTEAMPAAEQPGDAATELLRTPGPAGLGDSAAGDGEEDVLDQVFAESNFREYEPEPLLLPAATTLAAASSAAGGPTGVPGARGARRASSSGGAPTALLWTAGALAAVLVLIGLFFLGTRIPEWTAAEPEPTPTVEPTPTPEPTPEPEPDPLEGVPDGVPLPAGEWEWSLLRGGECIDPWVSPWEEQFTVVDCAEPHAAQLVLRAPIAEAPEAYPGPEAISAPLTLACSSPQVIDYGQAGAFTDIQIQTAYPVTPEEWAEGYREFFCFISRSSGEPLTGNLTLAPPSTDAPTAGSAPAP